MCDICDNEFATVYQEVTRINSTYTVPANETLC